ncbi:hypothetical protein HDU87_005099 [Geranomyces variabilis]|uniref:Transcriptional regulator n=1 Tax=Geranomyces variabilis TaxID=109894 RepID=A0AAD5XQT8_9FUNG|nr:hypothetical protein HDU87_005099 [Geranomyces variabilis]
MAATTSFASLNTDVLTEILLRLDGWAVVRLAKASSWILRHIDWPTLVAKRLQSERIGEPALFATLDDLGCLQSDLNRWQNPAQTLDERLLRSLETLQSRLDAGLVLPPLSTQRDAELARDGNPARQRAMRRDAFAERYKSADIIVTSARLDNGGEQILWAGGLPVLAEHFYHMRYLDSDEWTPMLLCRALDDFFGSDLAKGDIIRWNERRDLGPSQLEAPTNEWTPASMDDPREWAANPQLDEPWSQFPKKRDWVALTKDATPKVFLSAAPEIPKLTLVHRFVRPIVRLHCSGRASDIMAKARKTCQRPLVTWPVIVERAMQMNGHKITAKELTALRPAFSKAGWPSSRADLKDADNPESIYFNEFNEEFGGHVIVKRDGYRAAAAALGLGDNSNVRPGAVLLAIFVLTLGPETVWLFGSTWLAGTTDVGTSLPMYTRADHAETSIPPLRDFIRANPLGCITSAIDGPGFPLLQSTLVPLVFDFDPADDGDLGSLRGHLARANPHAKAMIFEVSSGDAEKTDAAGSAAKELQREVLILFTAPAHHYVTPKFYTETKPATGKVVPTWNYASVEVRGRATIFCDSKSPATQAFVAKNVADLSNFAETEITKHSDPWKVDDAPASYIAALSKAIIGVQIRITSMAGRFKMSQESTQGDRDGVVAGFKKLDTDVGREMAHMIQERGLLKDLRHAER